MASIVKRGEYSFQVIIRRRGYPTQTKTFETKTDAQKWARMVEREIDRGDWQDRSLAEKTLVGDVMRRYLQEITPMKKGSRAESARIKALLLDPISGIKMTAFTGMVLAAWRDKRLKAVSSGTVNRELCIISHAMDVARREWGFHIENPCDYIRRPAPGKPRDRRLRQGEWPYLREALANCDNRYMLPVVEFALETGMRRGELLSLQWSDVNLDKCTAHLPETKNGTSRTVALSVSAVTILRAQARPINGNVFGLTAEGLRQAFERAVARARRNYVALCELEGRSPDPAFLTDFCFHDLRHEATSRLFEKGLNVMEVASITGHKTLQMLKRYTHLRAEDLARKLG